MYTVSLASGLRNLSTELQSRTTQGRYSTRIENASYFVNVEILSKSEPVLMMVFHHPQVFQCITISDRKLQKLRSELHETVQGSRFRECTKKSSSFYSHDNRGFDDGQWGKRRPYSKW